jgi:hypothetical protein
MPSTGVSGILLWPASLLAAGLAMVLFSGCSGVDSAEALAEPQISPPERYREGGLEWQLAATFGKPDEELLQKYFRQLPDLAGSPELAGMPWVYTSGAAARRYIWLRQSIDGPYWHAVQFSGGRFRSDSGKGLPWPKSVQDSVSN